MSAAARRRRRQGRFRVQWERQTTGERGLLPDEYDTPAEAREWAQTFRNLDPQGKNPTTFRAIERSRVA